MLKFSAPFSVNVNINCQNADKTRFETKIRANDVGASIDSEKLYASANLDVCVVACEEKCERVLASSIKCDDAPIVRHGSKITVYYPNAKDTLFSVAKKYHTSPTAIASANSLTESVFGDGVSSALSGVKKLVIF